MPGPDGVGFRNNLPPTTNQPNIGNVGNIGGIQPGGNTQPPVAPGSADVQPLAAQQRSRASDIAGQLDVLLLKAAKSAASEEIDSKAVYNAAKAAKLPKAVVAELKKLADTAQESLKALDAFAGKDLAAAMQKKSNGDVVWTTSGSNVSNAIDKAQNDQAQLSLALANALGQAKDAQTQATLEDLMLKCDRRIGEIESLVEQMTEIIDKGGDKAVETAAALVNGGTISSFSSADALDKYGRNELLNALKADLKPLTDRLAAYSKSDSKDLAKADIDNCIAELNELKDKFSATAASGQVTIGNTTYGIDRSILGEATKLLDGIGKKLASFQREVVRTAMSDYVEKGIPFVDEEILSPKFAGQLHNLVSKQGDTGKDLEKAVKTLDRFRSAARAYVESPTKKNGKKLQQIASQLAQMSMEDAVEIISKKRILSVTVKKGASDEFKAAFARFQEKADQTNCSHQVAITNVFAKIYENLEIAVSQLLKLGDELNAAPSDKYFVSGAVLDAFRGVTSNSTIVESRVHGYGDSDINPALDDRNVAASRKLGTGNYNTVSLVKLKDGTEWVFKPEVAGRLAAPNSPLNAGLDANQQVTRINLAVQHTADTLGLGDIMTKTTAGTHNGQFGMFMEKAPGMSAKRYAESDDCVAGKGNVGAFSITKMNEADFGKVIGRLMRQENRMHWFDMITGQGDRHSDNYMVEIKKSDLSVTLKAIDNDASYGVLRLGPYKYQLPATSTARYAFEDAIERLAADSESPDAVQSLENAIYADPGVTKDDSGLIKIDFEKTKNPRLIASLLKATGMKNVVPPAEIDRELYDKLMTLANDAPDGGTKRQEYLDSLAERLGRESEQYNCAVLRLDESIAHARRLMKDGKVYSAEQWEDHDVQRQIAAPNLANRNQGLDHYDVQLDESKVGDFNDDGEYLSYSNGFFRDFYDTIVGRGLNFEWFK